MYPILDTAQFESHGEGFGATDSGTLQEINKALTAGYARFA